MGSARQRPQEPSEGLHQTASRGAGGHTGTHAGDSSQAQGAPPHAPPPTLPTRVLRGAPGGLTLDPEEKGVGWEGTEDGACAGKREGSRLGRTSWSVSPGNQFRAWEKDRQVRTTVTAAAACWPGVAFGASGSTPKRQAHVAGQAPGSMQRSVFGSTAVGDMGRWLRGPS